MKIVINKCFGGFSLSDKAIREYAKLKGIKLYPEEGKFGFITYYTVPKDERVVWDEKKWNSYSLQKKQEINDKLDKQTIYNRDIERNDPALVKVVEKLGDKANGEYAELKVVEIPDDIEYIIEDYDGKEWIAEKHQTWG
jgi:hypothetical protein